MSVVQKIEDLLTNTEQDKTIEKFQQQYNELLTKGVIQPKGYNLASVNVIGDKAPLVLDSIAYYTPKQARQ